MTEPLWPSAHTPRFGVEVCCLVAKRLAMSLGNMNQGTSDVIRHAHPLVKIKSQRIRLFHAAQQGPQLWGERGERPKCAVYMQPEVLFLAKICQLGEIVNRTGVYGSGVPDHANRLSARGAIFG